MIPMELFEERVEHMVNELKNAPKAKHAEKIFIPGEMEWAKYEAAEECGWIEVTAAMVENMENLSKMTGNHVQWLED